jgi:hypothetical protein
MDMDLFLRVRSVEPIRKLGDARDVAQLANYAMLL